MASKWLEVGQYGQSVWYDNVARPAVETGLLARIMQEDGVTGGTSNPSIFAKNLEESGTYDDAIRAFPADATAARIFEPLWIQDIQAACDVMRPAYDASNGADGFISIEVEADLAFDTPNTVKRAKELHAAVDRPNVMVKVPGTKPGIDSFRQLTAEGVSINVTLLFSVERYYEIAQAYVAGMAERHAAGKPVAGIQSVASFFVSRIDTKVDALLPEGSELRGRAAVANAKIAYADVYQAIFDNAAAWQPVEAAGGARQRALWASTSTKNPAYSPCLYVDDLIGPDTVNTVPDATLEAFRTQGNPGSRLTEGLDEARAVMQGIADHGIDFAAVTKELEDEGVDQFQQAYLGMLDAITKRHAAVG
ncbi:MAG: transaldolase [Gaiellales bacterium]